VKDPRYAAAQNSKLPTKVGTKLWLFECLTCDKCIPVCPNDANFAYTLPPIEIPVVKLRALPAGGGLEREEAAPLHLETQHQIATSAAFGSECDTRYVFCPEGGAPCVLKPRFFGSEETFARFETHDGFFLRREEGHDIVLGRFEGKAYRVEVRGDRARFAGP